MLQVLSEPCGPPSSDSEREGSPRICATAGPRAFLNRSTTSGPAQRNHLFCNLDWAFNVSAAPVRSPLRPWGIHNVDPTPPPPSGQ